VKSFAAVIIVVALLWAAVIIAVATTLRGTAYSTPVIIYIAAGASITLSIVGATLRRFRSANRS